MFRNFLAIFGVIFLVFFTFGCAQKTALESSKITSKNERILDLENLIQDANFYLNLDDKNAPKNIDVKELKNDYLAKIFSVFEKQPNENKDDVFWVKNTLLGGKFYAGNLKEISLENKRNFIAQMDIENYPKIKKYAIVVAHTNVRAIPSLMPVFSRQDGFPFDRWQNSILYYGTPVLATHMDKTGRFIHVESAFVSGWVELKDIAFLSKKERDFFLSQVASKNEFLVPKFDDISMKDSSFLFSTKIGQIFIKIDAKNSKILGAKFKNLKKDSTYILAFKKDEKHNAVLFPLRVNPNDFESLKTSLDSAQIAKRINAMLGQIYGWGGMFESRDCSAFVRDIFSTQSLFLPRNSGAQISAFKNKIPLAEFEREEKENFIINHATPFYTLLYFRGHILLYIGAVEMDGKKRAIAAHAAFSTTSGSKQEGVENLIGQAAITTLHVGKERNSVLNPRPLLIDKITYMADLHDYALNFVEQEASRPRIIPKNNDKNSAKIPTKNASKNLKKSPAKR